MPNVYPFTIQVVDAEGRVATLPDAINVLDALATGNVSLSPRTIVSRAETTVTVNRTISGSITLSPSLALTTSDGQSSTWGSGVTPADYEVRFVPAGGATFSGSATNAWLSLASERSWTEEFTANCADGDPDSQITSGALEIRDVATSTVQTSATITFDQRISPIAPAVRASGGDYAATALSLGLPDAEAAFTAYFESTGILKLYTTNSPAPVTEYQPPNEWGRSLVASGYEVKFDVVTGDPRVEVTAFPSVGTWGNMSVSPSVNALLRNSGNGMITANVVLRATIRPVGGAPIASADYAVQLVAERYESGIIP